MTLIVHTAQLRYGGADRLDITRRTADLNPGAPGRFWAPSGTLLRETHTRFRAAERRREQGNPELADKLAARAWEMYEAAFLTEMRASYRKYPSAWAELLARSEVTLVCFCAGPATCHRRLVAECLARCGATNAGERPACEQKRLAKARPEKDK